MADQPTQSNDDSTQEEAGVVRWVDYPSYVPGLPDVVSPDEYERLSTDNPMWDSIKAHADQRLADWHEAQGAAPEPEQPPPPTTQRQSEKSKPAQVETPPPAAEQVADASAQPEPATEPE